MNNLYRFLMEREKTSTLHQRFLLRCAVMMAVMIFIGGSTMWGQVPDGVYYITNTDDPNNFPNPNTGGYDRWYLWPSVTTNSQTGQQYLTTFYDAQAPACNENGVSYGAYDNTYSHWVVKNLNDGSGRFQLINPKLNKYIVIRSKAEYGDRDVWLDDEPTGNEIVRSYFKLNGTSSSYLISPTINATTDIANATAYTAGTLTLNSAKGNKRYLCSTDNAQTPKNTDRREGLLQFYDNAPTWTFNENKLPAPTISDVSATNTITITDANGLPAGYTIRYTTGDGTQDAPTATIGKEYSGPIIVEESMTVKAVVVRYGIVLTSVAEKTVSPVAVAAPTVTNNYDGTISLSTTTPGATIYYTTNGDTPDNTSTEYTAPFSLGDATVIKAIAYKDSEYSDVTTVTRVAKPTIQNNGSNAIAITCATEGATIYYTTDGTTPTTSSAKYTGPLTEGVSGVTINAIAVKENMINSAVGSGSVTLKCAKPVISKTSATTFTIECSYPTSGVTIYYNIGDGSQADPTDASTEYPGEVTFNESELPFTVKAIAYADDYDPSAVATLTITQNHDYSQDYLTFDILSTGTLKWKSNGSDATKTISYSINNESWTDITSSSSATISVQEGDVVRFKGSNTRYCEANKSNYSGFADGTATFNISGNIMSLLYGDNFAEETDLPETWTFTQFFKQSKCISAENLILPATTMTECCYRAMFSKCTTLDVAPALPATTLGAYCYYYMFEECAITSAPELPAPTLVSNCYGNMFTSCTSLNYILCLAIDKTASSCLSNWVNGVSSTGTFVKDENATWSTGASGIPSGWVVNDHLAPPEDPVITCDGEFITITCDTYGAEIYYRLGETGSYSLYSVPIPIHENTVVEAYAVKNELESDVVSENCIAIKSYQFAGMKITPGPLYYGSNGYEIKEGWNYDSYNSVYGKTVGSTYFNFIELGQLFESSVFSTSDGDIEKVLDPLDGWRVPTNAEWASIIGTTRSGSTVNGSSNKHYAMIQLEGVTHANADTPSGLLIFPDGETINTDVELSNTDNTTPNTGITASQLDDYLSQGCIFLPGSGYYDGSLQTWNNEHYYWSSTENNSSTGYDLYFEPSNTISSVDNKDKGTYYFPVYLVKDAADEATRLLRTWTYNNNEVEVPYSVNAIDGHSSSYARNTFIFTTDVKVKETQPTYLWFQHADQSADIYVNNVKVTTHWGGYTSFFVDITNYVHGGVNNIKVALCNTKRNTLAPYTGDFNMNATLGEVKLISSPVVPDPDYGYDGFHITSTVTAQEATITVKTSIPTDATLTCSIKGTNCNYSSTQTGSGEITFTTTITNPHLWNGTLDPYLYDVTLTIAKDGVVYHKFKRGYGLRFYEYVVDNAAPANSRFMLNGSPYLLRGVCMHNDLEGKANALTAADIDNDFEILKELGCNFVRLAHYPHPKEVYDRCDKMGIIVQTEAPCVNDFYFHKTLDSDYYSHLYIQYEDMVRQHFNHPCIMFWGLGNEIKTDDKSDAKTQLEAYRTFIKGIDSERWVGYVVDHNKSNPSSEFNNPNMDWFGCNIYVGWYIDKELNDPTNQLKTRVKNIITNLHKPLAFSEYGCGGTQHCHSEDPWTTTTKGSKQPRHDIEYLMWLHEGHIAAIKNHPQLLFTSQWQLFDIAVYERQEGYKVCLDGETTFDNNELKYLNNKGLVERDHRTKKDPFYLYKAWWNENNDNNRFVHICGKDYEKLTNRVIKCYTNDDGPFSLYVNNVLTDTKSASNYIVLFDEQDFNPGDVIRVKRDNSETIYDTFTFPNYSEDEDYVFTTNGNWNNAANWSPAVPTAARNVTINAACTIPKKYTAHVNNITIGENGSLTIADTAQLYHNNEDVIATVQKNIKAYTVIQNEGESLTDGWYFIASPVTDGFTPTGSMVQNTYDLYRLSNTTWENFKNTTDHPDFTTLNNGKGYLYANSADVTLLFTGTLKPYAASESVSVSKGWNLIGNPFTYDVYANRSFYKMNEAKTGVEAVSAFSTNPIAPCTGIVVEAETNGNVIFSKEVPAQSQGNNNSLQITLSQANTRNNALLDNAIVSFNEDDHLGKFYFGTQNANIYIPQNGKDYAIVSVGRDAARHVSTIPVNFHATENGTYTITVNPENVEMDYLHLIDNMTGADINLLSEGDCGSKPAMTAEGRGYTFEAKTTDYESRFKLLFAAKNEDGPSTSSGTFAFISNGNIIITTDVEDATLQVIDVMGRVIVSVGGRTASVPTAGMTAGIYMLRLINGNDVKTQKIVIK